MICSDTYLCVCQVSGAGLNLQSVASVVQQTTERLCRIKQEVNELRSKQQNQILQQQEYCKLFQERLLKVPTTLLEQRTMWGVILFGIKILLLQSCQITVLHNI